MIYVYTHHLKGLAMATLATKPQRSDGQVLSSAIAKIAEFWGFSKPKLGQVLGLSPATVSRLKGGKTLLDPASKSFEAGQFLLRLFRGLDALMGSDDLASRRWLETPNLDLDARPLDLIDSFKGLITVCDYVDAHRARV
ncbi:MAG: MbcA/ParS/Xre antitoxin family protein, partial [Steroidobacteraceae bacterium]|nr:MbcA/ParS/Xre antitoxin family protein [Steroidobacteraceae bacterium]